MVVTLRAMTIDIRIIMFLLFVYYNRNKFRISTCELVVYLYAVVLFRKISKYLRLMCLNSKQIQFSKLLILSQMINKYYLKH